MKRQQLVKHPVTGLWVTAYVDHGPAVAVPAHGRRIVPCVITSLSPAFNTTFSGGGRVESTGGQP